MPTYAYACTACDHRFDAVQKFTDDSLTDCPQCSGRLRKVYGSVGVTFKGSGFYRTDSRSGGSASTPAKATTATSAGSAPASSTSTSTPAGSGSAASTNSSGSSATPTPAAS